jgi:hypothetical protein
MIMAHRCGSGEFPENTIAAARGTLANTPSSTILHVDLRLTLDKQVVCFHDQEPHERNMLKLTGRDVSISTLDLAMLPPYSLTIPCNPLCDAGAYIDTKAFKRDGRTICTFEDLCEAFTDANMVLELWDDDPLLVQKVHSTLLNYRKTRHVVWGNRFSPCIQRNCETYDATVPTFNTATQWILVYFCYYVGVLPFVPIMHFDVFNAVLINEDRYGNLLLKAVHDRVRPVLTVLFLVVVRTLNWFLRAPGLFQHLSKRGIPVVALNVNDV